MPLPPHTYKKEIDEEIRVEIPEPENNKCHIFQALENTRELHALQNWDWFARDEPKLLRYLAEITQRPIAMLRMNSGLKHRLKMEKIEAREPEKFHQFRFHISPDYVITCPWRSSLQLCFSN